MALVYWDKVVVEAKGKHPGLKANLKHPTVRMVREAIDGKSVFHLTEQQALDLYGYYNEGWPDVDISDEFGESVYESAWKSLFKNSYYMVTKDKISEQTIGERWDAYKMEKEMLKNIEEESKNEND